MEWLPEVLAKWKAKYPAGRLLIFFHELPGKFPIASRHYWINLCNRRIIRKLARLADVIVTNTSDHATKIMKISGRADVHLAPVGSNILAPDNLSQQRVRTEFVIFGLPFSRWQTLQMFDAEIRSWQRDGCLTKLHLVGPRDEKFDLRSEELIAAWPDPHVVIRHGILPSLEVSKLLAGAQFALTNATSQTLALTNVQISDLGNYIVRVTMGSQFAFSVPASLQINLTETQRTVARLSADCTPPGRRCASRFRRTKSQRFPRPILAEERNRSKSGTIKTQTGTSSPEKFPICFQPRCKRRR